MTKAIAPKSTSVATKPEVVTDLASLNKAPTLRIASDATKAKTGDRLTAMLADAFVVGSDYTKRVEAAAKEVRTFRLMFPAKAPVRALLGDNAPDLIGETPEYRQAWNKVQQAAINAAAARLVEEGASEKAALANAKEEAETFRKSVSRRFRLNVEAEARKLGATAGAKFLLAHGFDRNGECGPNQLITAKGATLALPEGSPEGTPFTAETAVVKLPTTGGATTAQEPKEQSDQTKPGETASALIRALEETVEGEKAGATNPIAKINLAIGLLNDAAALLTKGDAKTTLKDRDAARAALLSATKSVALALGGGAVAGGTDLPQEVSAK